MNFVREVMHHAWAVYGPVAGEEMLFENKGRMRRLLSMFIRGFHLEVSDFEYFRYNCGYDLWTCDDGEEESGKKYLELAETAKNDSAINSLKEFMNPDFHQSLCLEDLVVTARPVRENSDLETESFLREMIGFAWQICKPMIKKPMHWRRKAEMRRLLTEFIRSDQIFEIDDFQYIHDYCGFPLWTMKENGYWYHYDEGYLQLAIESNHLTARDSFLAMRGRPDMGNLFIGQCFEWDVKGINMKVECTSFNDTRRFVTICEVNREKASPHWRIKYELLEANKIQ